MFKFIDDLAGGIYDVLHMFLKGLSYLIAGMLIVSVPLYLIVWLFDTFGHLFY